MTELMSGYELIQYDDDREQQFFRRGTDSRNLPRRFKPEGEVDKAAFNDAITGIYLDKAEATLQVSLETEPLKNHEKKRDIYERAQKRVVYAIDYRRGVPYEELRERGEADPMVAKEMARDGLVNYVLKVARLGAREVQNLVEGPLHDEEISVTEPVTTAGENQSGESTLETIRAHEDLDDIIKSLYEKGRMKALQAQSLLLLFELQASNASPEARLAAMHGARSELHRKIRVAQLEERLYADGKFKDARVEKGVEYLALVTGNPFKRSASARLDGVIDAVRMQHDTLLDRQAVKRHVHSHVGYALEKLYP